MVIAVLLQRASYLFSTYWYFKSHRILSCCLTPLHLHPDPDHIQNKVGVVNTSEPAGRENPSTKEPPINKAQQKRENTQSEERVTLEHPDKEIKETTPLSPTLFLL